MRLIRLKFKIIIGVILFIVLIGAGYSASLFHSSSNSTNKEAQIGEIVYKGKFLTPVENFTTVTSKYGNRINPISRKAKFSYWY